MRLPPDETHVWIVALSALAPRAPALSRLLSVAERERIAGYRRPADRLRRTVARGALREVLGAYLERHPAEVEIVQSCVECGGAHGALEVLGLCASLSYAPTAAVIAVARSRVGVDIEPIPPRVDWRRAAAAALSREERDALACLPERDRATAFINAWTVREALGKASGGAGGDFQVRRLDALRAHVIALAQEPGRSSLVVM